jgi:hypothetical protein
MLSYLEIMCFRYVSCVVFHYVKIMRPLDNEHAPVGYIILTID